MDDAYPAVGGVYAGMRPGTLGAVGTNAIRTVAAVAALRMELRRTVETRTLERWAGCRSGREPPRVDQCPRPPRRRPTSR
jgi:hypothetical protein